MIKRLLFTIFLFAIIGCTSLSSQNTQFISQKKQSSKESRTIVICRPSVFFHGLNSLGVRINSLSAFDLGSGEIYQLELLPQNIELQFLLPNQDPLFIKERKSFNLIVQYSKATTYVLVGHDKSFDEAILSGILLSTLGGISTTTWRAAVVDKNTFDKLCKVNENKTNYLVDKILN